MPRFPELPSDDYAAIYLEDTDRPLPEILNPGTRYTHFKTIAKGGKSIIQSCKDRYLARVICYKKLKPEFAEDPVEQTRFLREARVSASLQHTSIIPTYELGRDSRGHYYFTMKLVHGFTMRELFDERYRDRYDLDQLTDVLIDVANALRYAHSHRVIHRDIKPENILVGPFGEVLLMDWGLAKVWRESDRGDEPSLADADGGKQIDLEAEASSVTGAGNLEGTLHYMSPEQLEKDPGIDYRTDIYSMGVLLYEMLARRTPFVGEKTHHVIQAIREETPPRPSELTTSQVPRGLEELALHCMARRREDRVQGCGELIERLRSGWR